MIDRGIADSAIPATLRNGLQRNRSGGFNRQQDLDFLAVGLDLAEILILLDLAGRQNRRAEISTLEDELELVAIHVVAIGDLPASFDGLGIEGAGREAERELGIQRLFGADHSGHGEEQEEKKADQHGAWFPSGYSARVSAATQLRYSGRPCAIGTAMISGSS